MSFTQEMQSRNMSAESKVTICEERLAEKKIAKELGIPEGSKVIYLERIRIANNEPMALEKVFLISERFPGLTDYDFETQSLYEILERDFNCYPIVAEEMIESIVLDKNDARLMNISENSPALRVSRITRDDNGNSVEVVETLYRADRYQIFLIRRRQEGKGYS
jgi:GntR family transcriptional regulator